MRASALTADCGRSSWPQAPGLAKFQSKPGFAGQILDADKASLEKQTEPARAAPIEVSFGPFRLLPAQFLLVEGGMPLSLGSRALEILIVLVERSGELVSKQELMDRVWPNVFVQPNNLTVHMSALRRTLRDGQDGNRFIINIPGRGYKFVASVATARPEKAPLAIVSRTVPELGGRLQTPPFPDSGACSVRGVHSSRASNL
jgi:DNA-binding winged helix-turn-helix (wHTH) protein